LKARLGFQNMRFLWMKGVPVGLLFATGLLAQNGSRIAGPVDEGSLTSLPRTTHRAIQAAGDLGRVAPDMRLERMQLMLASSPAQLTALDRLLREQQDAASPSYRQWLTPEQFGERFGASQQELDTVADWLRGHGFRVDRIASGRRSIEFSGTAGQVEQAFRTEIHRYSVNSEAHIANSTDLSIPAALAAVVTGVVSLHDFRARAQHRVLSSSSARPLTPQYTNSIGEHSLAPYDFATIYDLSRVWGGLAIDGTGQKIAIVARSNINLADVAAFRSRYGLPPASVQVLVNGPDPGILSSTGDDTEADLDVEWSGAVAKGAMVVLVVSGSTATSDGVDLSSQYIVDHNVAPVVSMSFGFCEADNGSFNTYYDNLWQQAVAQGMSVFVATGDNGSAGCDDPGSSSPAHQGFGVNGLASTPYNVAVGGSEFNENGNDLSYWSSTNAPETFASALGYIPEVVWNESTFVSNNDPGNGLWAGSGGVSIVNPTPSWQTGPGVPTSDPGTTNRHHRYLPDVSLAAAGHDGYRVNSEGSTFLVSGTSASTPSFAGIMALIDQYTNSRNGNPNPQLYALAQSHPSVFHDITSGNNAVPCSVGFLGCSGPSIALGIARMGGYSAGPGYDLATGLGSVDIYQLVTNWSAGSSGGGGSSSNPPPPGLVSLSGAHLATGGGWETLIELINPTGTNATAHLRTYDDQGKALSIPLSAPDASINTTASGLDTHLGAKSVLILRSAAPASGPLLEGSAEVTSDTRISGFLIFRWTVTGQEVLVPLSSSVASSYVLAFDNTGGLATGIALASSSLQEVKVGVVARDRNGLVVANGAVALPALGHTAFVVSTQFPALANQRGILEFTPPVSAQVSVMGLRATPSGAFTGIPVLAQGANGSGDLADLVSGGGWETLIELVNSSAAAAQAHLRFYADSGGQLALPVTSSDLGLNTETAAVDATLAPGGSALISSAGAAGSNQLNGSAQLTSDPGVAGFLIFQLTTTGQEVLVPTESGPANAYVIAFDQTNGLVTGISLSNSTVQMANVLVTLRDQNGVTFTSNTITLAALGHKAFVLTDLFPPAAGKYGTVEIAPLGGQIGVVGVRATPAGALTSVPVLAP
jgi:pseudomonalisin